MSNPSDDEIEKVALERISSILNKQVSLSDRFKQDLDVDSMKYVEILLALEETFNVNCYKSWYSESVKDAVQWVQFSINHQELIQAEQDRRFTEAKKRQAKRELTIIAYVAFAFVVILVFAYWMT